MKKTENRESETTGTEKAGGNRILRRVLSAVCLCVTLGCLLYLGNYFLKSQKSQNQVQNLKELIQTDQTDQAEEDDREPEKPAMVEVNGRMIQAKYADLYEENPDFIGWITIPDTKVDYPVMQNMEENEYYIHRNFDGEYDGSGLPFLDNQCRIGEDATSNLMIYGHNMKAGTMFAGILKYQSEDFYKEHTQIRFDTLDGDETYEVIAAFYSEIYPEEDETHFKYYEFFDAEDEDAFDAYVEQVKALTPYEIDATANYGDTLITLSTCAYHTENGRFAVVARKVEE